MEILDITKENLQKAINILHNDGVIVYPTETAYGLGCDASSRKAIEKIYAMKRRDKKKPLPVICADIDMVRHITTVPDMCRPLIKEYWPGALTLVLPSKGVVPQALIGDTDAVAVRISESPVAVQLSRGLGEPIVATSANIAEAGNLYKAQDVITMFKDAAMAPDLMLNGGDLEENPSSTIADCTGTAIRVLRQGNIIITTP